MKEKRRNKLECQEVKNNQIYLKQDVVIFLRKTTFI